MALIDFLLTQDCIISPWLREANGEDVYDVTQGRKCRIQHGKFLRHTYVNPNGPLDQIEGRAKMFCTGDPIPARSLVSCDGETYIVIDCYRARGFGENHLEVLLQ